ncbi:uncharacterized protein UBRO2_00799 [Ustilago bromivora]|uniref:EthD domain-containing protein n=1 Tax=Ustilago bromivora TaxID=307758 RepID=A0A8H8QK16_9BASI|nr:uncharacterized protein UBRO2_00799 [Ustilago bromivora]
MEYSSSNFPVLLFTAHLPPAQPSPALPARIGEYQSAITYLRLSVDLIDKVNQDTVGIYDPPEASRAIVAWCYSAEEPAVEAQAFFHDEETAKILGPDAQSFTDPSRLQVAVGREFIAIAESNVVKA